MSEDLLSPSLSFSNAETHKQLVYLFCNAYPSVKMQDYRGYVAGLVDLDPLRLRDVLLFLLRTEEYLPSVAVIRRCYYQRTQGLKTPDEAWQVFEQANMRRANATVGFKFQDAVLQQAVDRLGLDLINTLQKAELHKRFLNVYADVMSQVLGQTGTGR